MAAAGTLLAFKLLSGPMDGTAWEVRVRPDSFFSLSQRETLVFDNGRLSVLGYLALGFTPALYIATNAEGAGGDHVFSASLAHVEQGIISWHGLVRGDEIEGVALWWSKNGRLKKLTFKGRRKEAAGLERPSSARSDVLVPKLRLF
ncbi:MAG: hypothetical protein HY549_12105 [Elusimicrobia bacterium]|nr:hypothetical protein [Elusimicrobiota bacterium]